MYALTNVKIRLITGSVVIALNMTLSVLVDDFGCVVLNQRLK